MKHEEYIAAKEKLTEEYIYNLDISLDDKLNRSLNFMSANLTNFIPEKDVTEHEGMFREVLLNQRLSWLDIQYPGLFDYITCEDFTTEMITLLTTKPTIICTFHLGSIRLINYQLGRNGIKFSLVVSGAALDEHQDRYQQIYQQHQHYYPGQEKFNIISAQSPTAGIQMLRELKSGKSLLIYIDGNSGTDGKAIQRNGLIKVNFLAESLYARKGVAYFSHLAQVPIIMVANFKKSSEDIRFKFYDPIYPDKDLSREEYVTNSTQKIYNGLSSLVLQYPGQWETWLNLHSMIKPEEFSAVTAFKTNARNNYHLFFNLNLFGLFNIDTELYLFNKRNYTVISLNPGLFDQLKQSILQPFNRDLIPQNILNQLIVNRVLI